MNRIERISAIIIQLQSKKIVKAQEIADRFEISLRTVYRDIRALEETGVPLIGEAGVGYSLVDGYRLPPIMFTKEEAIALITAEKLVEKFSDQSTKSTYDSALYKIKAVLKPSEKENLNAIAEHIQIIKGRNSNTENPSSEIQNILKSIAQKSQIEIHYFTNHSQSNSTRIIEPVGIFHSASNWYLVAFCLLRKDYRNFKINRISSLKLLEKKFEKEHPSLMSFLEKTRDERELIKVVIVVEKTIMRFMGEEMYYQGYVSQQLLADDRVEITFLTASLRGFCLWMLYFGEYTEIIEPSQLKTILIEQIEKLSKKYLF
jgi:predicted DNA-binding transcriptional regulator YafY